MTEPQPESLRPHCPVHGQTDCSPLLNGCSLLTSKELETSEEPESAAAGPGFIIERGPDGALRTYPEDPHGHTDAEVHEDAVGILGMLVQALGTHHPLTEHVRRFVEPPVTAAIVAAALPRSGVASAERDTVEMARGVLWHQEQALKYPVDSRDRREHYRWRDLDARDLAIRVIDEDVLKRIQGSFGTGS